MDIGCLQLKEETEGPDVRWIAAGFASRHGGFTGFASVKNGNQ